MKKLSRFDLGIIIAAVIIALLGGGGWWYLSGQLQAAVDDAVNADRDFNKYSTKSNIVVSPSNAKALQANIDVIKAQLNPLITGQLQPKENRIRLVSKEDPVVWTHDLTDEVKRLKDAAKLRGVTIPSNFYFGFSRYVSQPPGNDQTAVLGKQLIGIEQLARILINAPVKTISAMRRTYEEEPHNPGNAGGPTTDPDRVAGFAFHAAGNVYTAYPFEIEFETTSENLRSIMAKLIQSPYVFVVRSLVINSTKPDSPMTGDLDRIAGPPAPPIVEAPPGEAPAPPPPASTKGPQYLFGDATLKIKARVDMIEWTSILADMIPPPAPGSTRPTPAPTGVK